MAATNRLQASYRKADYRYLIDGKKDHPYYIVLGERDFKIIKDCFDFIALPLKFIIGKYYSGTRGNERMSDLRYLGFLCQEFYHERKAYKKDNKKYRGDKVGALLFCLPAGAKLLKLNREYRPSRQDPRIRENGKPPVPKKEFKQKFDVYYKIGELYSKIPSLLSRKETLQIYDLKGYSGVDCAIPSSPPLFIHVIGKDKGRKPKDTEGKYTDTLRQHFSFINSKILNAKHIIAAREHDTRFVRNDALYIPWDIADEVICNIAQNPSYYLEEFIAMLRQKDPKFAFLTYSTPDDLIKINTSHGVYHIGELFSGSNILREKLFSPPPNTLIYTYANEQLRGIKLRKTKSFDAYFTRDQKPYRVHWKGGEKVFKEINHPLLERRQ